MPAAANRRGKKPKGSRPPVPASQRTIRDAPVSRSRAAPAAAASRGSIRRRLSRANPPPRDRIPSAPPPAKRIAASQDRIPPIPFPPAEIPDAPAAARGREYLLPL